MDEKTRVETDVPGYEDEVEALTAEVNHLKGQLQNSDARANHWYHRFDELQLTKTEEEVRSDMRSFPLLTKFIVVVVELAMLIGGLMICFGIPYRMIKYNLDPGWVTVMIPGALLLLVVYARADGRLR